MDTEDLKKEESEKIRTLITKLGIHAFELVRGKEKKTQIEGWYYYLYRSDGARIKFVHTLYPGNFQQNTRLSIKDLKESLV